MHILTLVVSYLSVPSTSESLYIIRSATHNKRISGVAPRLGGSSFSPDVEGRSPEDSGLRWVSVTQRLR